VATDDQVTRLLTNIVMGVPKNEVPIEWTPELDQIWDRLSAEVEQIHARGRQVDLDMD
jgi:hypothetical protein